MNKTERNPCLHGAYVPVVWGVGTETEANQSDYAEYVACQMGVGAMKIKNSGTRDRGREEDAVLNRMDAQ